MKLVLVRHGRSEANAKGLLAGRADGVALDETGRGQAAALREPLSRLNDSAAYHSPILRCLETAQLAGLSQAQPLEGLTECDYGEWTNRSLKDLVDEPLWRQVQQQPSTARFPDGESMEQMRARVIGAVDHMRGQHPKGRIVIAVSHGDPIKAIIADALAMDFDEFQRIHVAPGSISIIDYGGEKPFVLCLNADHSALKQLATQGPSLGGGDAPTQ